MAFTITTTNINAKATYVTPFTTLTAFKTKVDQFVSDEITGITTKEIASESYKAPIVFFDINGDECGTVTPEATSVTMYGDFTALIVADANLGEAIAGMGGEQSLDETKANWSVKIKCSLLNVDEEFYVTFFRTYATVTGAATEDIINSVNAWFATNVPVKAD